MTLKLDNSAVVRVVGGQSHAAVQRAAERTAERARGILSSAGRVRTGALRDSIQATDVTSQPMRPRFNVGSALPYAVYQEFGAGPSRARGKVLRFQPKGSVVIFRPHTRGFQGAHYLAGAIDSVTAGDFAK